MPASARWQRFVALSVAVLTALTLALSISAPADALTKRQRKIHHALDVARNQKGDPYRYGANGPGAFDCSGLTQFSYGRAGLFLPRTSGRQARYSRRIVKKNMRKGDLMFFYDRGGVYHVGIYVGWNGNGRRRVLHAAKPGTRVHTSTVWTTRWFAGTLRRR
jgi:cell wall-associated NlpC family hydrolase